MTVSHKPLCRITPTDRLYAPKTYTTVCCQCGSSVGAVDVRSAQIRHRLRSNGLGPDRRRRTYVDYICFRWSSNVEDI
ncbi:hypothetical protein B0H10DRAFT_2091964 [Mycena sp. CBHHK59/15]|nr:hypothetical protein B0H10DRAFT_2091964 [Mycena sp. CBHHK59/15]